MMAWENLIFEDFRPTGDIEDEGLGKLESNVIAMREALTDSLVGGSSSRYYYAHDHSGKGGHLLARGFVGGYDKGSNWQYFSGDGTHNLGVYAMGWDARTSSRSLLVIIKALAVDGDATITFTDGTSLTIKSEDSDTGQPSWYTAIVNVTPDPRLTSYNITAHIAAPLGVRIYTCLYYETSEHSTTPPYHNVAVGFDGETPFTAPLNPSLYASDDWVSSDQLKRIGANIQAAYEATWDQSAPGSNPKRIQGHDHETTGSVAVPMGKIGGYGIVFDITNVFATSNDTGTPSQWFYVDENTVLNRRSNGNASGTQSTVGHFWCYSPTSWGATPHNAVGVLYVLPTTSTTLITARFRNLTTGTTSTANTPSFSRAANIKTIDFNDVPMIGGWNEILIEIMADTSPETIYTLGYEILEVAPVSVEASTGSEAL